MNPEHKKIYAFVLLETPENAQSALNEMNNITIEDTNERLYVNFVQPKVFRKKEIAKSQAMKKNDTNLFIRSLLSSVTEAQVQQVFSKFGKITSCRLKEKNVKSSGGDCVAKFGYINFEKPEEAQEAYTKAKKDPEVQKLLNTSIPNYNEFIFYHQAKNEREKFLATSKKEPTLPVNFKDNQEMMKQFMEFVEKQMKSGGGKYMPPGGPRPNAQGGMMGNKGPGKVQPQINPPGPNSNIANMASIMPRSQPGGPMGQMPRNQFMNPMIMNPMMGQGMMGQGMMTQMGSYSLTQACLSPR